MNPKFSVAIPTFNRSDMVAQAIRSVLLQTTHDFEVIVSDNCSSEDLSKMIASFGDSRVRLSRNDSNIGPARNHQRAADLAKGNYIITLNSDDLLLPSALEAAGECLDRNLHSGAVYFSSLFLTDNEIRGFSLIPPIPYADSELLESNPSLEKFHGTSPSCCLFRKEAFEQIGGYRTSLKFAYDWDLFMRFVRHGNGVSFLPKALGIYRRHPAQTVQTSSIDGLRDILELWNDPDYQHWRSTGMGDLILSQLREHQLRRHSLSPVFKEIQRCSKRYRLLGGIFGAAAQRVAKRMGFSRSTLELDLVDPDNSDHAVTEFESVRETILGTRRTAFTL